MILQHAINKEPVQLKSLVGTEVGSRIMNLIQAKRVEIGTSIFGEQRTDEVIDIKKSHEGLFHKDMKKKSGSPITDADIEKGLKSEDPAVRKRANFARNARKWKHKGK